MTIAELLAFDVSCRSRRRVSSHRVVQRQAHPVIDLPYPTLQTRRVSRHRCSDQRTQEWISTFGRRVDKQYGALARRYRHFGSLDGVELRLIEQACYSTHLIDGTMPFHMIDGRQVIESLGPPTTTYYPTRILPHVTPTSA
ncbi:BZ3500_MvSof-1268-A1-R1_Chr1-3g01910 [Microbotryum saponariae]|uniref:BZ3500_MvSof-1268-A1-R1_Chr1-3g01910 protein n=1 Tax=Microbotryum saponariae TaxID=289078 RepID=A0A2X0KAN5_9BASI|nr:BZ3500_MvSof-1268-A1-R1_Chr1-3g01910 [Microbotryum saponariae]SCZ94876.1 BZ3501_MvSof-1269-A2-R1_Chr1-3g01512 [Microbotryum saponariae]